MRSSPFAVTLFFSVSCAAGDETEAIESDIAGSSATEIKVQIEPAGAIATLGLSEGSAERREVTFYDTPSLELFDDGVVLRARRILDRSDDDTTVKLRPMSSKSVDGSFFGESGFKCELDKNVGKTATSSCSLTKPEPEKDIVAVGNGENGAKSLFSSTQETFLEVHDKDVPWSRVVALGPIDALVWKIDPKDWKSELTVERWIVPGGSTSIEVSLKTRWRDRASEEKRLIDWLAARGLKPSAQQETKTRAALVALANR